MYRFARMMTIMMAISALEHVVTAVEGTCSMKMNRVRTMGHLG